MPLLSIVAALLTGCGDCKPPAENVLLDDELSAAQVVDAMESFQVDAVGDVTCEQLCLRTYQDARGWEWIEIEQCTLALDQDAFDAALAEGHDQAPVGSLSCTGVGYEYLCR